MSNAELPKKNILVLTPRYPFPVIGGDRLRIYKICQELAKHYNLTLLSLCDNKKELNIPYDKNTFKEVHRVYHSKNKSILNVLLAIFSKKPLQIAYYKSERFKKELYKLLPNCDATLSHLIRVGDYVKNIDGIHILEMTDAISLNYQRVKNTTSNFKFKSLIYSFEQSRLYNYEKKIINDFTFVSLVSQIDKDFLYPEHPANVIVSGNGVDTVNIPYTERKLDENKPVCLVFIGNMYSLQNMDGVRWFCKEVLPYMNLHGNYVLKVIGRIPENDKRWLDMQKNVITTGEVENIIASADEGHIGICPIRIGAGIQNKVLEYMALGLPCITSTVGYEGIGANDGKELFIADSKEQYLSAAQKLINDANVYSSMADTAKLFVEKNFSWTAKLSEFIMRVKNIL